MFRPRHLLSVTLVALAVPAAACDRFVEITGVRAGGGAVRLAVYADEASFREKPAVALQIDAPSGSLRLPACSWPSGEVAIAAFQDRNANEKLDTNVFGVPTEPYVVSRTPGTTRGFGAPSWAGSRVTLAAGTLTLELAP